MTTANNFTEQFAYKTLTKIHGEPDYQLLKRLRDEVKANASKITTSLGGGDHGHLGMCMHPPDYVIASAVPYVQPPNPGLLVIPPNATARAETCLREDHKKSNKTSSHGLQSRA